MNIRVKKARIYTAIKWEFAFKLFNILKKITFPLFIAFLLIFLYGFIPQNFTKEASQELLGVTIIFLSLSLAFQIKTMFFEGKLKNPPKKFLIQEALLNLEYNLAELFTFRVAKAVLKSKKKSSGHLLYYLIKNNPELNFIFHRLLLKKKDIIKELKSFLKEDKESFERTIKESINIALRNNHDRVFIGDLLSALVRTDGYFKNLILMNSLEKEDIDSLVLWLEKLEEKKKMAKRFWEYENLAKAGTLAKEWTSGYTITLDQFSRDITEEIKRQDLEFIGHENKIKVIERILSRGEIDNVLVIGEEGTGRKSMIYALAQKSLTGKSMPSVNYKRFVELDLPALLAETEGIDQVELTLDKIFNEVAMAGNVVLLIDGLHNYIGQELRPGVIDISGVIAPYLRLPQFQIIGITNYEGLHRNIERNPSVLSLFGKVEVSSIDLKKTLILLQHLTFNLEKKYNIFISYPAIREIIELSEKYFPSLNFPEKAIAILDEVSVYVSSLQRERVVLPKHVATVITEKTEIPVGEIESKEKEILLNLEDLIHKRIINQVEAVKEVSTALRRARSEVTVRKGPMGAFLFLGPTGVGKTETTKALAHFYFGSEKKMIRLDMSEFQSIDDIGRLIGSPTEPGLLTTPVKENPFSIVLLDELEKADLNILNLFLQVLDEGYITDGMGRKVSFNNTIIVATSNAGYKVILKALKEKNEWSKVKQEILDHLFENQIFRPEFINRFDATVVFKPLSKENLLDIAQLMLTSLRKNLSKKGIEFIITEELKEKVVELGYNPVFGAREMRRVIQDKVENALASALLSGDLKRGEKISLDANNFNIKKIN